jgi:periplasmic protein TonB
MKGIRIPALDEFAFAGRNKEYGAYHLRRRYPRYLLMAVIIGTLFMLTVVFATWSYYFLKPSPLFEGDLMNEMAYYEMTPLPEEESSEMPQAYAKQPEPESTAPVVTDSLVQDKPKPEEKKETSPDEAVTHTDTAATEKGSGQGTGVGDDTGLTAAVDVRPRYPGGDDARLYYLRSHVKYPLLAIKAQIQGVVMVVFIVESDGSISHVDVSKRIGGGCDEEAIRVTREMPRWEPGKRNGNPVRVMVRMPIVFRIPGK